MTISRCPASMLAINRTVSVAGRRMKVEISSIGARMMSIGHGTPDGNRLARTNPMAPRALIPATTNAIQATTASSSGTVTTEVEAMLSNGTTPVMFIATIAKNITVSSGTCGRARRSPRTSSAMSTRTKSSAISAMFCARPGTSCARLAAAQKSRLTASAETRRTSVIRLISKIVPSNAITGGKKSAIDGMCIPPSSPEAARSTIVARVDRTVSWAGRWAHPDAGTRPQRTLLDRQNPNVWWTPSSRTAALPVPRDGPRPGTGFLLAVGLAGRLVGVAGLRGCARVDVRHATGQHGAGVHHDGAQQARHHHERQHPRVHQVGTSQGHHGDQHDHRLDQPSTRHRAKGSGQRCACREQHRDRSGASDEEDDDAAQDAAPQPALPHQDGSQDGPDDRHNEREQEDVAQCRPEDGAHRIRRRRLGHHDVADPLRARTRPRSGPRVRASAPTVPTPTVHSTRSVVHHTRAAPPNANSAVHRYMIRTARRCVWPSWSS